MGSHTYFYFTILCMVTLVFADIDGMNATSLNQTEIKPVSRQVNFRVLGGTVATDPIFRTLARIVLVGKRKDSTEIKEPCTATVLSRRWLLTAAHCFFLTGGVKVSIEDSYVFVGERNATLTVNSTDPRPFRFAQYLIHKDFVRSREDLGNDIALIFLDRPIPVNIFRNVRLSPRRRDDPQPVAEVQVAGYGLVNNPVPSVNNPIPPETKLLADSAMQAPVTLQTFAECNSRVIPQIADAVDESKQVCSVPQTNENGQRTDTCFGDSGGPIFTMIDGRIVQFGITSFSSTLSCGKPETVVYSTRVSNFRRVIRQGRKMNFASWNVTIA